MPLTRCIQTGGGGGALSGDNFGRGKFRHTNFGAGPSDTGNFDTPNPWFLVKLWPAKLTLYPLGPPPDELLTNTLPGQHFPGPAKWTDTEDAQRAGNAPNYAKNFRGENFDPKLKNEVFPTNLSPDEAPPPPPMYAVAHAESPKTQRARNAAPALCLLMTLILMSRRGIGVPSEGLLHEPSWGEVGCNHGAVTLWICATPPPCAGTTKGTETIVSQGSAACARGGSLNRQHGTLF